MHSCRYLCALILALAPSLALAHHGQDFLILESPSVPHPGDAYLLANAEAALGDPEGQGSFEPALLIGITPRVAFELHAHTEKLAGENWNYEATAPGVHVLLTDPAKHDGLKIGIGAEYEFAAKQGAPDNAEVRLSFEKGNAATKWGANLIASREQGGSNDFGAALGFRHEVCAGLALGAEAQSSFQRAAGSELLISAYTEREAWAFKFGIGGQREEDGHITPIARVGLVLRLKD